MIESLSKKLLPYLWQGILCCAKYGEDTLRTGGDRVASRFWEYGAERLIKNATNAKNNPTVPCHGSPLKGMSYILEVGFHANVRFRRRKNATHTGIFHLHLYKSDADGIFKMETSGFEMLLD